MFNTARSVMVAALLVVSTPVFAQNQTIPGAGNDTAAEIARGSKLVRTSLEFLLNQAKSIDGPKLRLETLDAIGNVNTCVRHRANVTDETKDRILAELKAQGLVRISDDATFPGGL